MTKNLKLSYILLFAFSAIVIAFKSLSLFLLASGVAYIALTSLLFVVLLTCLKDKEVFSRIKDLFFIACGLLVMETVIYFACEFGYGEAYEGFHIYQNVISFIGFVFLAYWAFRFTMDSLNKKVKFIEIMLGNEKRAPKAKKSKELSNGSLEEKPSKTENQPEESNEETEIIIETEE